MEQAPKKQQILIVDDEEVVRNSLSKALRQKGMVTRLAGSGKRALELLQTTPFDAALLDIIMPDIDGIALLKQIRNQYPLTPVIMITAYPTIETAIRSVKFGAVDYLVKPFRLNDLSAAMEKISHTTAAFASPDAADCLKIDAEKDLIIGESHSMRGILEKILRIATTDSTILITGESGTGKELVARAIHAKSPRCGHPFVAVDCSSLGETLSEEDLFGHVGKSSTRGPQQGLLESAHQGTLLLDEIANLSPSMQAKLLRFIQERELVKAGGGEKVLLDIRILSSSNQNLEDLISSGRFREDLFYRLSVVPLRLPPLRMRQADIPLLMDHFLQKHAVKLQRTVPRVSTEALEILQSYSWPGNVRELEHTVERILVLGDTDVIRPQDLPAFISQREGDFQMFAEEPPTLEELEKRYIRFVLRQTRGKKAQSASILGINRKTLTAKIKKYDLY
jgi:DNA-binding NtrC family response regulator